MLPAVPSYVAPMIETTPADVQTYLSLNGWTMVSGQQRTYFKHMSLSGYMTWEQAVAYQMFKKLTLGAI